MTDPLTEIPGPTLTGGLQFLRTQAVAAHQAGDGFAVNHICRVALTAIEQRLAPPTPRGMAGLTLAEVRWVFSLWLSWLPSHELVRDGTGRLGPATLAEQLAHTSEAVHDLALLSFLFDAFANPLEVPDVNPLLSLPATWLESRSQDTEDMCALSLAIECVWYGNPTGDAWRHLVTTWRGRCAPASRLAGTLERLESRLSTQGTLCMGGQSGSVEARTPGPAIAAGSIERCWEAFFDCDWTLLDQLICQIYESTCTDSNEYFPLFSLIRMSSLYRQRAESEALSLSRRAYSLSRQPGQVFTDFRSHSFKTNALRLHLKPSPGLRANELWKCFLLAMLGQLSALRSWDIGRWLEAVGQQADAHLELAQSDEPMHAVYGLSSAVWGITRSR